MDQLIKLRNYGINQGLMGISKNPEKILAFTNYNHPVVIWYAGCHDNRIGNSTVYLYNILVFHDSLQS